MAQYCRILNFQISLVVHYCRRVCFNKKFYHWLNPRGGGSGIDQYVVSTVTPVHRSCGMTKPLQFMEENTSHTRAVYLGVVRIDEGSKPVLEMEISQDLYMDPDLLSAFVVGVTLLHSDKKGPGHLHKVRVPN